MYVVSKVTQVYFDTEFTDLDKNADLISIGMVSSDGKGFYAEVSDFDIDKCSEFVKKNVLPNMVHDKDEVKDSVSYLKNTIYEPKSGIVDKLKEWLNQFEEVQFVSDVCHYDMVLLLDLFGGAINAPGNIVPCCHDINQDIAKFLGISDSEAFDYSREVFLEKYGSIPIGVKHNSMYDALVIKEISSIVNS